MSEEQQAAEEQAEQKFEIQKIYIKDISFESPNPLEAFGTQWAPNVNVNLNTDAKTVGELQYEVILTVTVTTENEGKTAFLVEVQQAGIFSMDGFEEEQLKGMLGSFCPDILFPYAREAISDLVTRGGFPQLLLAPVNFDALFMEHMRQEAEQQATATTH